jgi:hypothetical protein
VRYLCLGVQAALAVLLVLNVGDFVEAVASTPCHDGGRLGCFPWGSEGPSPWYYRTKSTYLATGVVVSILCVAGMIAPAWLRKPYGLVAAAGSLLLVIGVGATG